MLVTLNVITGPHKGRSFRFANHDTFLVGRSKHAHFQLPAKDKYFSRIHFLVEVNPPHCRLIDMGSLNGTYVNGQKVLSVDLKDGDQIRAGHTVLAVQVQREDSDLFESADTMLGPPSPAAVVPAVAGYTPVRQLGRGTLGQTYLAARTGDGKMCAVKIVHPQAQGSPAQVQEFLHKAQTLAALSHPAVVPLRDLGFLNDFFYFVWDFIPGKDASEVLAHEGPLPVRRALRWMDQLLPGLEYAHAMGVVLRDMHPSNIRVHDGLEEAVLWTNFGLSRLYSASPFSGLTMTGDIAETAAFLPPETITNYQAPTPLGDQYAVAANLYFLLTRENIYRLPKNTNRRFSILLKEQVVPIQERRPDIPAPLAHVVHKALSRQPGNRFASVAEFHKALTESAGPHE